MKTVVTALLMFFLSVGFVIDADAKQRLGGGKSSGMQREAVKPSTPGSPTAPNAASAAPANPGAATAAAKSATPAPTSGMGKWLGPLAGLAAGGLLAALFMGGAFGGLKMLDIVLMIAIAAIVFFVIRAFRRKNEVSAAADGSAMRYPDMGGTAGEPMQRAAAPEIERSSGRIVAPEIGSALTTANASPEVIEAATIAPRIPADFDLAPFERNARAAFIRMQAANDARDIEDIRDFSTPEMYAELALQIQERGGAAQRTEVVSLNVRVLEVITENDRAIASVRYTGVMREADANDGFDEIWHVVKNLKDDKSTWRLAGIQQLDA